MKALRIGVSGDTFAKHLSRIEIDHIEKRKGDETFDQPPIDCHPEGRWPTNEMFRYLVEMDTIHVIDAISSFVFLLAFVMFNVIYWNVIVA